jgi:ribosomal protein S18 acetylase RimI-like enzyme
MKIRRYRSKDEKVVIDLWIESGLVTAWNNPKRDIERKLKVNPEWFLVGEHQNKIIATCMAGYEGHRGWINYLAVSHEYQRRGFATKIMQEAQRLLRKAGCPKINLLVRKTNANVIEFYKTLGFNVDDVVSMGKRLFNDRPYRAKKAKREKRT